MSHLRLEALARLLDEPPTEEERAHLGVCDGCRTELEALRGQTETLAALPNMVPAPDLWPEIRERLLEEQLVKLSPASRRGGALRAAAAVVLFLAGGALGYAVRGEAGAPRLAASDVPTTEVAGPATTGETPVQLTGGLQEVEEAQERFFNALDQYMAATAPSPTDPATRLATLDNIVLTTAEALNESPADPVINSFHLTALAQRNAMLRQIATSSDPVF